MHQTVLKQADIEVRKYSYVTNPFYVDVTIVQQESDGAFALRLKLKKSDNIDCCEDLEGTFVSRNHIFRKGTCRKLRRIYTARIPICNGYGWVLL